MILVILTYQVALPQVDQHLEAHRAFLAQLLDNNQLVMSGPQEPRTGGVMLLQNLTLLAAQKLMQQDPFYRHHIAQYQFIAFTPK